jgi:outer membrane lipoprotein carrier protein
VVRALAVLMAAAAAGASALPATPTAAQPSSAQQVSTVPQPSSAPQIPPGTQQAAALLERYLAALRTLRVSFLQTLTDAQGREIGRATGTLIVERPGKFSWDTHPQRSSAGAATARTGQLMVCDGTNLWFFDRDLAQVTVKPVEAALSATPAMLLSGVSDLRKSFSVAAAGSRFGLDWVLVEPRGTEADFSSALFGFAHGELKRMILEDKLGETATISFEKVERNGPVAPGEVSFIPPPGTDVIGTPRIAPPGK